MLFIQFLVRYIMFLITLLKILYFVPELNYLLRISVSIYIYISCFNKYHINLKYNQYNNHLLKMYIFLFFAHFFNMLRQFYENIFLQIYKKTSLNKFEKKNLEGSEPTPLINDSTYALSPQPLNKETRIDQAPPPLHHDGEK